MKTIWKFPLKVDDAQSVRMPTGATILSVQVQHDQVCLWALVEPDNGAQLREIIIYGTGHEISRSVGRFIGTFQLHFGSLVFHVFEGPR